MRVLMVCLGNICRSPIAEGVMRAVTLHDNLNWYIDSAGIESYHIGDTPHVHAQKACQKHGIDISKQRARKFVASDLNQFDKIYAMSEDILKEIKHIAGSSFDEGKISLFLNELYPGSNRSVPDPWYGPEEGYAEVYDMIDRTCRIIAEKYKSTL
jgi:protein-tyrosine phosphatase